METKSLTSTFQALGTVNTIRAYDAKDEKCLRAAAERVEQIGVRMSAFREDSDLGLLASNAGGAPVRLHADTLGLLRRAASFAKASGGAFDPTIRPLTQLWGIGKKGNYIPSRDEIAAALELVDYRSLLVTSRDAFLERAGQKVDLGGMAKGYAADEVRRILLENGVRSAVINLGGNVIALGSRPDGKPWRVGIQNPLAPTGEFLGTLGLRDQTVVTSGCNERFFLRDGVRYHHILDPRTGNPARSGLLSVTAVSRGSSADADALTTALFILGPEKSMNLLRKSGAEALFIFEDMTFAATNGMKEIFQPVRQRKAVAL